VRVTRLGALDMTKAETLRARVAFLRGLGDVGRAASPSVGDEWPDWSDAALLRSLDEWLTPYLAHSTGRADLERLDVAMLLTSALSWDQQTMLDELAPAVLVTPKGRPSPIDYTRDPPTVSVRVQFVFGMKRHPTVAGGRVPLAVELLSPADRPIQITRDLPGFWTGSWAQVRKEMVGRYPKHAGPPEPA
jgi:ATP-dependent helicase HrpB